MADPGKIHELVDRFGRNLGEYKAGRYNETQVRREFIDPFFKALGWDIDNENGYAEAYKEVVHEDAIKVGHATKAPDYSFRIGGVRKFFLEAKKPSVSIKEDIHPAYQLRRYAWSAKLPVSILTDFEELAVYDCRVKPVKTDKAATARIMYLTFDEYAGRWDELAGIFSPEAIRKGSFDKFAQAKKGKRGAAEVDEAFLEEIERWRDKLARNLALRNPNLSQRDLNFAVQRTIDRIIFLRICEDRGIEHYETLRALQNGVRVYPRLVEMFYRADERYNSGLFHFDATNDRPENSIDNLTPDLILDDAVLKALIKSLYYPDSPYEFSVLPADILGQVYERFLGKVIRLTAGHRAVVEDKPEVRKAGGVYYTPTYIVDYIVRQTVGKLLQGKKPGPRGSAGKLKILDPACGSGSFLLGAYQFLLDWHLDAYLRDEKKWAAGRNPRIYKNDRGEWRLTTDERKRILLSNIYGVDIDQQAVEVTKLSLLLKVLEGENEQSISRQLAFFHQRVLPELSGNIKCGNSLIGPDFYDGQQLTLLDEEELYRINAFDWQREFAEIMAGGGFDAVIGNPPYIRIQTLQETTPRQVEFLKKAYCAASSGNYDIYVVFVEKGLSLLNSRGRLGFILPHKFFNSKYGEPLRGLISKGKHLSHVVHFADQQVFEGATTYTALMFLDKAGCDKLDFVRIHDLADWKNKKEVEWSIISAENVTASDWNFVAGGGSDFFLRLKQMPKKLGDVAARMAQGIRTSANEVYVLDLVSDDGRLVQANSKRLNRTVILERSLLFPFLQGREIKAYQILHSGKMVLIPYRVKNGQTLLIPDHELEKDFPHTYAYLRESKTFLENRERGKMRGQKWYAYVYPKNIEIMKTQKILVPDIADRAAFGFDKAGEYAFTSGYGIVLKESVREAAEYILGLLNSKVLDFYLKNTSTTLRGGFFRYFTQFIEQLPIRTIDFSDPKDKTRHDRMVALVERMLELHRQKAAAQTGERRTLLERQIAATDQQIDRLVYELYELTQEEIKIVEESTKAPVKKS